MTIWFALPEPGDIVWCRFPEDLPEPGPKPRPALVLKSGMVGNDPTVLVAFGTSKRTSVLFAGEFAIRTTDDPGYQRSGLSMATKFNLRKTVELPYNNEWFSTAPAPSTPMSPKVGELHATIMKRAQAALQGLSPVDLVKLKG